MSVFALLERLAPHIEKEVNLVINAKQEAETLSYKLKKIQVGLQDAEKKGVTNASIKDWLKELEDVAYEMDDVLDEWETANLRLEEVEGSQDFSDPWEKVYGRDDDKVSLVEKLVFRGEENSKDTQIISIIGLGGVGKTTLAQLAYNDPQLESKFELKAWVSVSEPFDASAVARAILEAFGKGSADIHELETLVQRVREFVQDKKFLLVLDDVWTEDRMKWECLKNCLRGARGSRILVTTRSESVARIMGTSQRQTLGLLSDSYCGTILNKIALDGRTEDECERLRYIGMEIAEKCNGLPLAARTVGSMLALRFTEQEWRDVLESPLWKYEDEISDLFRLLKLSYVDLSPVLKRCFLSCIVYSKGSTMHVDKLIRIWMAYGYLSSSGRVDEVHLEGSQYFRKLAVRSFFQKFEGDERVEDEIPCKLHDIMHDFANYLSGSEDSFIMDGGVEKGKSLPLRRAHHNMLLNSLERIHTFCARYISQEELPLDLLSHLKRVRVLIISKCELQQLPQEVGKLIRLRYLDLSHNPIRELPETVSDLCNLQTLDLENCYELSRLPEGIGKLINLRHLLNSGTHNPNQLPQGLEKLTSLWTLSEIRAWDLAYLRNLNQLQGSLCIFLHGLNDNADGLEEVRKANLKNKNQLRKLELYFSNEELTDDMVEALEPPPDLQTLATHGSAGKWFSNWIDKSFNNLKVLEFDGRQIFSDLPPFGKLPTLEKLVISNCDFKCLSMEFLGNGGAVVDAKAQSEVVTWFPRLKKLHFHDCDSWKEWEDIKEEAQDLVSIMPCLEELKIHFCNKLRSLPHTFLHQANSLKFLEFSLSACLENRYYGASKPDWDKISHIPHVKLVAYTAALNFIKYQSR